MALKNGMFKSMKAVDLLTNMKCSLPTSGSLLPAMLGVSMNSAASPNGDDSSGLINHVYGVTKDITEGSPMTPCIRLDYPSMFRFRWVVKPGQRRIAIRAKQVKTFSSTQRPSMIIKANAEVGIPSDIITYAPEGLDWVLIGPVIFTATGTGMVFVEIRNNLLISMAPAFFDHIVAT